MLTPGTYRARAIDGDFGLSSKNTEQIAVRFQVTDGPNEGATLTWYGFFNTPENAKRAMESLRRCGWRTDDVTDLAGLGEKEVEVVVEEEEYQGKKRLKVRWINDLGGGPTLSRPMDDAHRRAFAARMKGLAMAVKPKDKGYPVEWDKA